MVEEIVIVQLIHVLTITWSLSAVFGDWENLIVDGISLVTAIGTWFIIMSHSLTRGGPQAVANRPLFSLFVFSVIIFIYTILTAFFVLVRDFIAFAVEE